MSDDSLTMTVMDSQADSASTASTADMDVTAGENGMDDLISDSDAASFRYIRLVIYSARNVLCKDYSGFSDPYVEAKLADNWVKTRVITQTFNPDWNQEFVLRMAKSENPLDHTLCLNMWDFDGIRRAPDFLGQVNVDLTSLYNANPDVKATEQTWFQLQDRPGMAVSIKAQGNLCLGIEFINYAQARQLELIKGQGGDAGSVARYSDYSLTLKVHGTRGLLTNLKSGLRKGLYVESRVGSYANKTKKVAEKSLEGDLEVVWDKSDVVHMDDAMAVPATGGFYKSVAHHFYENAYRHLQRNGAFEEVRFIVKRSKAHVKRHAGRSGTDIVGIARIPLSRIPIHDDAAIAALAEQRAAEEAARNPPPVAEIEPELSGTEKFVDTMKDLGHTIKDSVNNLAHNIPEPMSKVLQPITAALHPHSALPASAPTGADTEVHVDEIDKEAEAAKEVAEQRFWLPLERSKGRRMGELCVSLLFTKGAAGEAVVMDDDEDEPVDGPAPEPLALPDALPIALVDESLPVSTKKLFKMMLGTDSEFVNKFFQARKYWDINMGQWTAVGGERKREVLYTMPLKKNALGPSEAACIEQYKVVSKEDGGWLVTLYVTTPKVPYGTSFHQNVQWACRSEGRGKCRLRVTGEVEFTKSPFVKGMIQKASEEGMKEAYLVYMDTLREELGSAPPVTAATVAQRAQDSAEGMHSQTRVLQGLAIGMLLMLLLLVWNVWGLRRTSTQQLQLLQQLAEASLNKMKQQGPVTADQCQSCISK
ncbi:hypothetical protein WJX77_003856 [Trebouxia sp. C0004]